ncbi:hypothetical protein BTN50_1650 (plasmid) [Candidatus Enterovibrio altilux]|uniref:Mobile element protein n=1 Tax=Candidatus Enterovibrio altilux TaxID=1927128 RepID=A0A291BAQ5_9GAMM|nr:hypothetical protein BTN50_1650 [Candidatus Enterovibrio luxaltus]
MIFPWIYLYKLDSISSLGTFDAFNSVAMISCVFISAAKCNLR